MEKLTVLHVKVGEAPEVIAIDNSNSAIQKLVGGYYEPVPIGAGILMIVNEEGKIHDLPANFVLTAMEGSQIVGINEIVGDVFFVGQLGSEFHSLDKLEVQQIKQMFEHNRNYCIVRVN